MPNSEKPLHVFTVELTIARQWGGSQQVSVDALLHWTARLSPELGLRLHEALKALVNEILPGALRPISESGAKAFEDLGKEKQLPLLPQTCELPK